MSSGLLRLATRLVSAAALVVLPAVRVANANPVIGADTQSARTADCHLNSAGDAIKHVIWLQFDNVHFKRDNLNVPSDLEQMPNLLNFIEKHGTLLSNHHTPLISHTAGNILGTLTGVYPDRHGQAVSNSYRYFKPDGSNNAASSFAYWTDPLFDLAVQGPSGTDTTPNMIAANGKIAPAPWVPFTRAGCDVGGVGTANIELENATADVPVVFGPNSPEEAEVKANTTLANADFIGIAVHCAANSALCKAGNSKPDLLPDEPGNYKNFTGLFGHKYVAPAISPDGPLTDLDGNVIKDASGNLGFPGFDGMVPTVSLAYVAAMQEHGIPVTFNYVSDAHERHGDGAAAFAPGEAEYVAQLKTYDDAFGKFFARLQSDGMDQTNTLFVITADEGDHLIAGPPSPADCDGIHTPCTYSKIGEISGNISGLLATERGITTPFGIHSDSAPNFWINGNPAQDAQVTRNFERALGSLTAVNPYSGNTETINAFLADQVEMRLLHMVTADPARTPTVTMFAKADYFLSGGPANCNSPCITVNPAFAWNHGDFQPEITTTFLGLVGPGIKNRGVDSQVWTDHTDTRPTALSLVGLKDDYQPDGRVIFEVLTPKAMPEGLEQHRAALTNLAHAYKQLNGAVGAFGLASLSVANTAATSDTPGDAQFAQLEQQLTQLTNRRNGVARQMINLLNGAAFRERDFSADEANDLTQRANELIGQMEDLAANPS
jgi:arylsulfatase A-like enzyme